MIYAFRSIDPATSRGKTEVRRYSPQIQQSMTIADSAVDNIRDVVTLGLIDSNGCVVIGGTDASGRQAIGITDGGGVAMIVDHTGDVGGVGFADPTTASQSVNQSGQFAFAAILGSDRVVVRAKPQIGGGGGGGGSGMGGGSGGCSTAGAGGSPLLLFLAMPLWWRRRLV